MNAPNTSPQPAPRPKARGVGYIPAVGPRLRILLHMIFASFALLSATGVYLFAVRAQEWIRGDSFTTQFTLWMFLFHLALGVVMIVPFFLFGILHLITARNRPNQLAVKLGILLFIAGIAVVLSGVALLQLDGLPQLPTNTVPRWIVYGLHVAAPILAVFLYVLHRRAGPLIKWRWGIGWSIATGAVIVVMIGLHSHDPRIWHARFSSEGETYFEPSKARTAGLKYIPAQALMMDEYCLKCHPDIYKSHLHSAHRFSSFANPGYLFSVRETRNRMGVRASRWCAGCHDPVPFFSGVFDNPFHDKRFVESASPDLKRLKLFLETEAILDTDLSARTYPELLVQLLEREGKRDSTFNAEKHKETFLPLLKKDGNEKLNLDPARHPIAKAGVTCTVCHAITHINSRSGNGDYIIEEPIHYPFAYSNNALLQWVNNQLVKARPDFHKKTFLKPFHRDREKFCTLCHKVSIPQEVNHYKEFLRGQNHGDSYWLSGVSGIGVRSFYYPLKAKRCADCHMPLKASNDFGARDFDGSGKRKIHSHMFPGANTGVPALVKYPSYEDAIQKQKDFLLRGLDGKSPTMRIDIFGLKQLSAEHPGVDAALIGDQPLRPFLPKLQPGKSYLVDVVVRTLTMGHHFTQGTVDSNEVWIDFYAKSGQRLLGRSGRMDDGEDRGRVEKNSHFLNVLVLDRFGNRIDRRNPQDIFTPLYSHQIPPGAGHVVHYRLTVPEDVQHPVELYARVRYRKFDHKYMEYVYGKGKVPQLPIVDLCEDRVVLPVAGVDEKAPPQKSPIKPAWQRWNDYGIGCYLEGIPPGGNPDGHKSFEIGQAEKAFQKLLGAEFAKTPVAKAHGYLNLARVYNAYGSGYLEKAAEMLRKAKENDPPAPWWTVAWYSGLVNLKNANYREAIDNFKTILDPKNQPTRRNFDFTKDWVVINTLGKTYFELAKRYSLDSKDHHKLLRAALRQFEKTLIYDPENIVAHDFLHRCYQRLAYNDASTALKAVSPTTAEKRLLDFSAQLANEQTARAKRIQAGKEMLSLIKQKDKDYRPEILVEARERCRRASITTRATWVRLIITPVVNELDRILIDALTGLGEIIADKGQSSDRRLDTANLVAQIIDNVQQAPRPANVTTSFMAMACVPEAGLPVNLALAGMAQKGYLDGPLPPPRLLKLEALRLTIRPLVKDSDTEIERAAARILAGVHLTMHGIYKPDENAEGRAKLIYRRRHPAADRASHEVVIYDLK